MAARGIPGLALTVLDHGTVVKSQGYGQASVELDVPATPETVFDVASVTKQFTAAAVMLLVEEGKLGLDTQIRDYLTDDPDQWAGVTVRHLLSHTAGFPLDSAGFDGYLKGERLDYTTAELYDAATRTRMLFRPGEDWNYSNVGYFLLGLIIEKAGGRPYAAFMAERLFRPLGMASTSVINQWAVVKNRASGYTRRGGELVRIRRESQVAPASGGGVLSTARDLATWDVALAAGKVVKASSLDEMWTPTKLTSGALRPYGLGWLVFKQRGHRVVSHAGSSGTEYARFPDDGLTVIVLTNLGLRATMDAVKPWGLTFGVAGHFVSDLAPSAAPPPVPLDAIPTNVGGSSSITGIGPGATLQPGTGP
jgi:CubicO group peptidase (beta-lactamase class C family)